MSRAWGPFSRTSSTEPMSTGGGWGEEGGNIILFLA